MSFGRSDHGCSIEGCARKHRARGLCAVHYNSQRLRGELTAIPPMEQRFWTNVDKSGGPNECWSWTGAIDRKGYGRFYRGRGQSRAAHRIAYELSTGQELGELHIDHRCWNPGCCNPSHLRPVTNKQNQENRRGASRRSRTGIRGVVEEWRDGYTYWSARVQHRGDTHNLGRFPTPEAAGEVARVKRLELFTYNEADR